MARVEVYAAKEDTTPLFVADFDFLPRVGEHLARDTDGYFTYYNVVQVWHRQNSATGGFQACMRVELDD